MSEKQPKLQLVVEYFLSREQKYTIDGPYHLFELSDGFKDTQLVIAAAKGGLLVSLVHEERAFSTFLPNSSSADASKTELDAFVRHFHTEAAHHRRLSTGASASNTRPVKVEKVVKAPNSRSSSGAGSGAGGVGGSTGPGALGGLSSSELPPTFEDEHQVNSVPGLNQPNQGSRPPIDVGHCDLDPLGKFPPMRPGLTGEIPDPFGGNSGINAPGGMHPTPWGAGGRTPGAPGAPGGSGFGSGVPGARFDPPF